MPQVVNQVTRSPSPLKDFCEKSKPVPDSPSVPPSQPTAAKTTMTASINDFFKERSRIFASKDPKNMRAPSPPKVMKVEVPYIRPDLRQFLPVVRPTGLMAEKLKKAAPYNVFLTTVTASSATHSDPLSVTFLELLDPSLGELESSVQLNFTVQSNWLLAQYYTAKLVHLPLLIFYGSGDPALETINQIHPNITSHLIKVPTNIGCHHTKTMLFFYKDKSMRVVVSTANLYADDWDNRVQGLWISDRLPQLPQGASNPGAGESVTNFREDFIRFLVSYKNSSLDTYIERIKRSDFSSVKVFLVASIPGSHYCDSYGHPRVGSLLKEYSAPIQDCHPVIMQSSSLGNFGKSAAAYLTGEILMSFKKDSGSNYMRTSPEVKLIYPSKKNVGDSHEGMMGGGCLPYHRDAHNRQPWLNQYLYQWKSKSRNRDRAMPHIKSYCRYSDDGLFWFVLTSSNMSKSAWGVTYKNALNINSYEVGVAFFPRVILDGKDVFPMDEEQQKKNGSPIFKLPFDIPPVPYARDDAPFCIEDMQEMAMALQGYM